MVRKKGIILLCLLALLIISACVDERSQIMDSEMTNNKETKEMIDEDIPSAAKTIEEMVNQKAGILVEEHMDQQLETFGGWDGHKYLDFLEETFNPIVEKELKAYFTEHHNLNGEQVYDYLVYMLASGNYKNYYEQLVSFDHGYAMPELPSGEDEVTTKQRKMNVVVLLDASGSMKGEITGESKMKLAKAAIDRFVQQIPKDANVSLVTYGHVGSSNESDKGKSCAAVEAVYPLTSYEATNFTNALNSFEAKGWTPLAGAINKAGEILQAYSSDDYVNLVYMVSDGVETCDGDPVAAAKELQSQSIKAKVNIIGFDVDNEGQQQLKQVAESGGGEYITVEDASELEVQITKKWKPSIGQLVWTQGVTLQEKIKTAERMNEIFNPLYHASDAERHRIKHAIYFLGYEDLISDDVNKQVLELADSQHDLRYEHFLALKEQKNSEIKQAEEELDGKVEEWKQQWENDE